jgi:hypothetical protein
MLINLLPCPFCGGSARILTTEDRRYHLACNGCQITIHPYPTPERAAEMWNRRSSAMTNDQPAETVGPAGRETAEQTVEQIAAGIAGQWLARVPAFILPEEKATLRASIAAAIQAERECHAAEINRQRQDARLIALEEAANLACSECRDGVAVAEVRPGMFRHHYGGDEYGRCEARRIHRLITQEEAKINGRAALV